MRTSLLALALMIVGFPSSATLEPSPIPSPAKTENTAEAPLKNFTVQDFLALTPKKYKEITGQKLSLTQKISLKIAQKKMKRAIKNNENIHTTAAVADAFDTSDFNIGGFILGLLLPVVGVLIAYLIGDTTVIKWAWVGFGVFFVIFLLAVLL
ncbi:MAG: hypothetical protein JNK79_09265 [Chitinophagaceae bacterium]|nr:hypothetical protein [Chitinophagaceae bacterium]